jgi:3'(2'), 5'-bisphosphate nucleotidase
MINQLLEKAIFAAISASREILKIYLREDFGIEMKADNSPLTIADKAANAIITNHLTGNIPILSEEGKTIPWETRKNWSRFWLVDPLDGTKEFIKRNGEFTVNIALIENGEPQLGVIVVPVSGELYYADANGSYKSIINLNDNGSTTGAILKNSIKLPSEKPGKNFVVVGSRSHQNPETELYINNLDTGGKPLQMVTKGSSLKLCMVATGEANCYPRLGPTMEWDIAAGHAIAHFAGKSVTRLDGQPLIYNKEDLLNPWFVVSKRSETFS